MVLKGLGGAALALPLLEGVRTESASAQDGPEPFAIFFRQACGVGCEQNTDETGQEPERFWPRDTGELTPENLQGRALDELTDVRSRLLVVRNVDMHNFDYGDGHARGAMQGLTARGPVTDGAGGDSEAAGQSIDDRIGAELNPDGRDSLFLYAGPGGGWLGGACISYRSSGNRRAATRNPWEAYQAIAGNGTGLGQQEVEMLRRREKSVNDLVRDQLQTLMSSPALSMSDRLRLEQHFDSVRELEVALGCRLGDDEARVIEMGSAVYDSSDGDDAIATTKLHMDVAALAVACGYSRSVAIQFGNGNDGSTRFRDPDSGNLMENYHYISHRRQSHDSSGAVIPGSDLLHHKVDRYFAQMFRHLVDRLESSGSASGASLLDAGVAVWYNDNGNGPAHSSRNIPYVLAGSANGFFKQGQYVDANRDDGANHSRMLNTIASAVGVRNSNGDYLDDFGDPMFPRGILDELLA